MNVIVEHSDWCHIDRLDGVDIKNGEWLRVRWPDGSQTELPVIVRDESYTISDMGVLYRVPKKKAYASITYCGVSTVVPLEGLYAERITSKE